MMASIQVQNSQSQLSSVNQDTIGSSSIDNNISGKSLVNSAIAGYAAGSCGVIFGHPLDSAKVWLQTNTAGQNKYFSTSSNTTNNTTKFKRPPTVISPKPAGTAATMSTLTGSASTMTGESSIFLRKITSTLRALYSGVSAPLISVGIVQSINFAAYDSVRRILHKRDHPSSSPNDYLKHDSLRNCGVAGFIAGSGLAFITSPLIMIKCQQQITGNSYKEAVRNALYGCNHKISIKRCFVGFLPHYGSEAFGRAIYYTVYEAMKRSIAMQKEEQRIGGQGSVTLHERMMSAGLAGIVCWAFIFPMDTLRSRMYSQKHSSNSRILSTTEMARKICKEGVVYRGFWVSVLRAGPVAAAVLPVYDIILEKLSSS